MGNRTREELKGHTSNFFRPMGKAYIPSSTASVPLLSLFNHLFIYFFLPLERKTVAFAFGCTTSCICMALNLGIELSSWSQVSSTFWALVTVSIPQVLMVYKASKRRPFCSKFQRFPYKLPKSHRCYSTCKPVLTRTLLIDIGN